MQESQNVPALLILILFYNGLVPESEVRPGGDPKSVTHQTDAPNTLPFQESGITEIVKFIRLESNSGIRKTCARTYAGDVRGVQELLETLSYFMFL